MTRAPWIKSFEIRRSSIELVNFADGTTWTQEELRNRMVSDMKAGGTVIGTENDEAYSHTLGDGSYSITDYDYHRGADSLTFTNIGVDDLTLGRDGKNLVVSLTNGEEITINRQLDENTRHSIETFVFEDGTTWNQQAIRNRMVADQKATGTVVGTENNEHYTHSLGDGTYSLADYDYYSGNDTFQFVDVNSTDIVVQRLSSDPNDVVMTLTSSEQITFLDQLHSSNDYGIETFEFADGVTWGRGDLISAPIVEDEFVFI